MIYVSLINTYSAQDISPHCRQLIQESLQWSAAVTGNGCEASACIFGDMLKLIPDLDPQLPYSKKLALAQASPVGAWAQCFNHSRPCQVSSTADFDVSGLPCPDMSRAGLRKKRAGPTAACYIAHGRHCTVRRTPLLLIECTPATGT